MEAHATLTNGRSQRFSIKGYLIPDLPFCLLPAQKSVLDPDAPHRYVKLHDIPLSVDEKNFTHFSPIDSFPVLPATATMPHDGTSTSPTSNIHDPSVTLSSEEQYAIACFYHRSLLHPNTKALYRSLTYYQYSFPTSILDKVKNDCLLCASQSNFEQKIPTTILTLPCTLNNLRRVGAVIHLDLFFISLNGVLQPCLIIRDRFSNFIRVYPLARKDSLLITKAFMDFHLLAKMSKHRIDSVFTDNGTEFQGFLDEYLLHNGIHHATTAPYAPQQNGACERAVQTIKRKLKFLLSELDLKHDLWSGVVHACAHAHNMIPSESGLSPHEKFFNSKPSNLYVPLTPVSYKLNHKIGLGYYLARLHSGHLIIDKETRDVFTIPRFNMNLLVRSEALMVAYMRLVLKRANDTFTPIINHIENLFVSFPIYGNVMVQTGLNPMPSPAIDSNELVDKAILEELAQFRALDVLGPEIRNPSTSVITTRFVVTRKDDRFKARLVLRGFLEHQGITGTIALPAVPIRSLTLIYAISRKQPIMLADVKTAFLHVPVGRRLAVKLPSHIPPNEYNLKPSAIYELKKHAYGLRDASKKFVEFFSELLLKAGYTRIYPGLHKQSSSLICSYVDDLMITSTDLNSIKEQLNNIISIKEYKNLNVTPQRFLGCYLSLSSGSVLKRTIFQVPQKRPKKEWTQVLINQHVSKLINLPLPQNPSTIAAERIKENQQISGCLTWRAMQSPGLAYPASLAASIARYPDDATHDLLIFLSHAFKDDKVQYHQLHSTPHLNIYTDAALHKSIKNSHFGYIMFLSNDNNERINPILWTSRKDDRLHSSTSSAELIPIIEAVIQCQYIVPVLKSLYGPNIRVNVYTDAQIVLDQIASPFNAKELRFELAFVKQMLLDLDIQIAHVESSDNPADPLTKLILSNS